jgi:hypothetical protein
MSPSGKSSKITVLLIAVLGLSNPSRCGETDSQEQKDRRATFTDEEIVDAVYSRKKCPPDFHCEDFRGGSPFYVSMWRLHSSYGRTGSEAPLCTMDLGQVRAWALKLDSNSSVHREIVEERETDKYFEVKMVNPLYDRDILLVRADKCSYLNRTAATNRPGKMTVESDSSIVDTIGVLISQPIAATDVSDLVEYLWYVSNFNFEGRCVLSSFSNEDGESIKHTIYSTYLNMWDYDMYDEVFLVKEVYAVDKETGLITSSVFRVRTVQGRYNERPTH